MGTLTANQARLPGMCAHKLPTSCRLSSIPECCACADERAHAVSYPTYIDGIGYVPRGTRWQRYCWFCKEFWENRTQASGLRSSQTRVPEVPDQTEFLDRWYEFHQGFRISTTEDGVEERIAVLGEDFRDVSPGCLPRTLDELRAGRERSELEEREREEARLLQLTTPEAVGGNGPTLDDELEQLFQEAVNEESAIEGNEGSAEQQLRTASRNPGDSSINSSRMTTNLHAQAMNPSASRNLEYRARRVAALHRELQRMRNGIERVITGLRDLGQTVPDHSNATSRLSELGQTLDAIYDDSSRQSTIIPGQDQPANVTGDSITTTQSDRTLAAIQNRVDQARQQVDEARRNRDQAASELDHADQELRAAESRHRQLRSEQRTTENYMRLFGTREEMVAQGDNYESPIGGMFDRADERFRRAEEVRREERILRRVLEDQNARGEDDDEALYRLVELESRQRDVWGVPAVQPTVPLPGPEDFVATASQRQNRPPDSQEDEPEASQEESALEEYYALLRRQNWSQQSLPAENTTTTRHGLTPRDTTSAAESRSTPETETSALPRPIPALPASTSTFLGGPPGHQLDPDPYTNNDRGLDAAFMLSALGSNNGLRELAIGPSSLQSISEMRHRLEMNALTWNDGETIEGFLENEAILWGCQLPAERNRRRRARQEQVTFVPDILEITTGLRQSVHHIEVMAECFQMSARIRQVSGLNAPDQLRMLYRLQRGAREVEDRAVLVRMLDDNDTLNLAIELHDQQTRGERAPSSSEPTDIRARIDLMRRRLLDSQRILAARLGDHSRAELNNQRQAAEAVSVATGDISIPHALIERIASRSAENRAAWERLQAMQGHRNPLGDTNAFMIRRASILNDLDDGEEDNDGEGQEDEPLGLDAPDSGRPDEPLSEEDMTVKLDCRICYSQISSIACLPCGHLSMCQWCSDQHSPTMPHDRTRPRRSAACPVCRKGIRQKVKIFRA